MRSSKSRSRSKQNRPRTLGNIINRVFDSSGPEGKVRGTPQQIIEKYQILARDAQLSNDRVAAENFLQHAEHYTRLLGEALREQQAEQDARQQNWQQGGNQGNGQNGNQNGGQGGNQNGGRDRDNREGREARGDGRQEGREYRSNDFRSEEPAVPAAVEVIDLSGDDDAGLVETPETRAPAAAGPADAPARPASEPRNRPQGPRGQNRRERPAATPVAEAAEAPQPAAPQPAAPQPAAPQPAAEPAAAAPKPRRARGPRKPRAEGETAPGGESGPREAAE